MESAAQIPTLPDTLKLEQSSFARNLQSGSRLDRYACAVCGTRWLVEIGRTAAIVDWYQEN